MKKKLFISFIIAIITLTLTVVVASAEVYVLQVGDVIQSTPATTIIANPDAVKYIVTSVREYKLSDAVTEYVVYTNTGAGTSQSKINIMVVDTTEGKSSLATGYGNLNPSVEGWTMCQATDQVEIYEKATGKNVIGCINASWFDVRTGEPTGMLVMNGTVQRNSTAETYIAYFSDGSVNLFRRGTTLEQAEAEQSALSGETVTVLEAVDAFSEPLVWDGKCIMEDNRGNYPRSCVGVTEEGKTIICQIESGVSDSVGYDCEPMSALMIKMGCVKVLRLDEGGSATFCSKRADDTNIIMRNTSVQGIERNISGSILIVDNTGLSDENKQTACEQGEHDYVYDNETGLFSCSLCDFSSAEEGSAYRYSGWAKDTSLNNEYFFVGGKKMTNYSYLDAIPTYFSPDGIARDGVFTINGESCVFRRGCFVECTTADVILAGYIGLNDNLYDIQFILYKNGHLVLTGSGKTGKYDSYSSLYPIVPWNEIALRNAVKYVTVGKDIEQLNRGLFRSFSNLESLEFEAGSKCKLIGLQTLYYNSPLSAISLPDGLERIDAEAFGSRSSLRKLYIPKSVKVIDSKAFSTCLNLTLYVEKGSYAESFAKNNNIPYEYGRICETDGHNTITVSAMKATCTFHGSTAYEICSICGIHMSEPEIIIALGHSFDKTDEVDGNTIFTCSVCGYTRSKSDLIFGDVDNDEKITVSDARLALRIAIGLEPSYTVNSVGYIKANVDGDDKVTVGDARLILRVAIKLDKPEESFHA